MNVLQLIGFPLFLVAAFEFLLAFILLKENPRNSRVNKSVSAFSFFTAAFAFITSLMYLLASFGFDITFLARANWVSWMMIPAGLQFVFYIQDEDSRKARIVGRILYPFWFLVFCLSVSTDLIERGNYTLIPFVDRSGILGKPLRFVGIILIGWVVYEIYRLRKQVTGIRRTQLNYFTSGVLIFCGGGAILAGVLQLFGGLGLEPGLGSYFSLPWVVLTFYAITRYRLFDIRSIISRTVTISLLAVMFSLIQIGLLNLLGPLLGPSWTITLSMLLIGFVFFGTPFTRNFQKWVHGLVIQDKFDYQKILQESSKAIISILELDELLNYLISSIKTSLGVESYCLFLRGEGGVYTQQYNMGQHKTCPDRILDGAIVEWVKRTGQMIIREELEGQLPEDKFAVFNAYMKSAGAEIFIPLISKGRLQGILMLGKKGNLEAYAQSDLDLLEALAGHAAVAIENARLYENARKVQESLRESEERFRNLIETTSDWVWEVNDRGVYTYVSPKIREILGYEPEEILGKTVFDFMPREEAKRAADFFVSLTRQQKPFMVYQNTCLHKSGRIVIIETSGVPVFDRHRRLLGYRGVDRDVTHRNELEGQLRYAQKMEAIGRLAAGVAHDFNNINTAVVGYANLLQLKMAKDNPLREHVDQIIAATERSSNLTRSLLAFSKKQEVRSRPLNLNDIVTSIQKLLKAVIGPGIDLVTRPGCKNLIISADQVQIERIIMNLVSNARDAMPNGGRLIIETDEVVISDEFITENGYGKQGTYARISITDTGSGIDAAIQKKIFEPFFTTKGVGRGTGFGLAIVYDIVKQHRGYITLDSAPGKGSAFHVYFPLVGGVGELPRPIPGSTAAISVAGKTILVADDNDDDRRFIKATLEQIGYQVIEAVNGEDAVAISGENGSIQGAILDIVMPKMSGKEAYQTIKAKRPGIKVLFTSIYPEDVIQAKGVIDSSANFILKPFSSKELLDRVRAILVNGS